jgi:hypothetical protein
MADIMELCSFIDLLQSVITNDGADYKNDLKSCYHNQNGEISMAYEKLMSGRTDLKKMVSQAKQQKKSKAELSYYGINFDGDRRYLTIRFPTDLAVRVAAISGVSSPRKRKAASTSKPEYCPRYVTRQYKERGFRDMEKKLKDLPIVENGLMKLLLIKFFESIVRLAASAGVMLGVSSTNDKIIANQREFLLATTGRGTQSMKHRYATNLIIAASMWNGGVSFRQVEFMM